MPKEDQGVSYDRFSVIPRVLIFFFQGEKVLLLKGDPEKKIWPNQYNGIGGHVEKGEDALSAAKRELLEETGLTNQKLELCGTVMIDAGGELGIALYVYKGVYVGGEVISSNEGSLEWIKMDELVNIRVVEDLPVILPRIYHWNRRSEPFSAYYHYDQGGRLIIDFGE